MDVFAHRIGTALAAALSSTSLPLRDLLPASLAMLGRDHIKWGVLMSTMLIVTAVGMGLAMDDDEAVHAGKKKLV